MSRFYCFSLYLILSAANGIVPLTIALLFSVSGLYAILIWGVTTAATFLLISLVCLRGAMKRSDLKSEGIAVGSELDKAAAYR